MGQEITAVARIIGRRGRLGTNPRGKREAMGRPAQGTKKKKKKPQGGGRGHEMGTD